MPSKDETKRRHKAPRGSGLTFQPERGPTDKRGRRLGEWIWRRVHPETGKRISRRTRQHKLLQALQVAQEFDDELRQELAGVKTYEDWRVPLEPLVAEWLEGQDVQPATLKARGRQVRRALEVLKLQVAADLTDLPALSRRLRALEGQALPPSRKPVTRATLRRCWQNPLRMFSAWLAEDGRYLPRDPLATWSLVKVPPRTESARRAAPAQTFARALRALDLLDKRRKRTAQRPLWTTLLVTGSRVSALLSRDVRHLVTGDRLCGDELKTRTRIDFGKGRGNKRVGAGELDPTTVAELRAYLGARRTGPLFLSPEGLRWTRERALDAWQEAYGLALVDELWPEDLPPSLEAAIQVELALRRGKVQVSRGGNPRRLKPETVIARLELHKLVAEVAERIRDEWRARLIDNHSIRKTHRSWALALGVPAPVIDKQTGHGGSDGDRQRDELARLLQGSRVGRTHYTDLELDLFDARRSAIAARGLLDELTASLERSGTPVLFKAPGADAARAR